MEKTSNNAAIGKNINSYSSKLLNNENYKIGQVLTASDGGHISIFVDAYGNTVGSINKDANGNVRNVSFQGKDGKTSYNDIDTNGTIDSEYAQKADNSKNGQNIGSLSAKLEGNGNYKIGRELKASDGGHIYIYVDAHGNLVGSINKDANGNVRNVSFERKDGSSYYNDMDKNGTIDNGTIARHFDIES